MVVYVQSTSPTAGQNVNASAPFTATWYGGTDNPGAVIYGMALIISTGPNNTGTIVVNDQSTPGTMTGYGTRDSFRSATVAASTLTVGNYYYVRQTVFDSVSDLNWVDTVVRATGSTSTPTITAPTAGATITNPTATVSWTLSPSTQSFYQVQVLDAGSNVVWDSGGVYSSAQSITVPFPDTGVSRTIRVRAARGNDYAVSDWATRAVTVAHTQPMQPTITALVASDVAGIGMPHALVATITQPTPTGGAPATTTTEVYVRRNGDTSTGVMVDSLAGAPTSYTYRSPASGVTYQMRLRVVSSDGRYNFSAWVTAASAAMLRGVVLFSLAAPTVARAFRFNGDEAEDDYQPEAALIQYDGREFPVVEFGTSSTRTLAVELSMKTDADRDQLRALLLSRTLVCYRDRRGRKMYAFVTAGAVKDTFWGYSTNLTITQVDYPGDRST